MENKELTTEEIQQLQKEIQELSAIVQANPQDVDTRYELGYKYYELKNYDKAFALCKELLQQDPENYETILLQGDCRLDLGKYQEALADYNYAISLQDNIPEAHLGRGHALVKLGKTDQARAAYCKVFKYTIGLEEAAVDAEEALDALDAGVEQSFEELQQMIQADPQDPSLKYTLAFKYFTTGEFEEAFGLLTEVVRLQPDHHDAWDARGICQCYLGNFEAAIEDFKQAIANVPEEAKFYADLGDAYFELGNLKEAKAAYKKVSEKVRTGESEIIKRLWVAKDKLKKAGEVF
ncbi:Hypothetical protein PBC10988_26200 [Planctomycetales bacterium 10988]|nr:Hypothetical protein PBC10988_26200 [Planctomycetales bacterium 10988]